MNLLNILSMIKLMRLLLLPGVLMIFLFSGCEEDEILSTKYDRPDWLSGKVFTQIKDQPELSVFASAVELAGYDSIIDVSGSYTVFAPSDEAFNAWMSENNFSDVQDIPQERLSRLVSYHIVQNLWTKRQLRTLDVLAGSIRLISITISPGDLNVKHFSGMRIVSMALPVKGPEQKKMIT